MKPNAETVVDCPPDCVGDRRAALELLVGQRYQQYYRAVLRQVGNEADAADIIQEAFLIATMSLSKFRGEAMLSSWLFGIAKNVVRAHRRRRLTYRLDDLVHDCSDDGIDVLFRDIEPIVDTGSYPDPLESLLAREKLMHAGCAMEKLRPQTREALWSVALGDADYTTLASELGVPIGTLKSRVSRGRSMIKARLQQAGLDDGPMEDGDE